MFIVTRKRRRLGERLTFSRVKVAVIANLLSMFAEDCVIDIQGGSGAVNTRATVVSSCHLLDDEYVLCGRDTQVVCTHLVDSKELSDSEVGSSKSTYALTVKSQGRWRWTGADIYTLVQRGPVGQPVDRPSAHRGRISRALKSLGTRPRL